MKFNQLFKSNLPICIADPPSQTFNYRKLNAKLGTRAARTSPEDIARVMLNFALHFIRIVYISARCAQRSCNFFCDSFFSFSVALLIRATRKKLFREKTHSSSFLNACQTGIIYFIFKIPLISWSRTAVCEKSVESAAQKSETRQNLSTARNEKPFLLLLETYSVSKHGGFANPQALGLEIKFYQNGKSSLKYFRSGTDGEDGVVP